MADQDIIQTTALAVVEQQQKIVGSARVGSAGAGALAGGDSQGQFDILEQIRELQLKSFRGIKEVVTKLSDMLAFDKDVARRTKEDANELAKENKNNLSGPGNDVGGGGDETKGEEKAKGLAALSGFFAGLPGVAAIGKLLAPITAFFGKGGMLVKLFGRFGPLGAIILGVTLLVKYSSEISKALAPAIDGLKNLFTKLKPAIDFFMMVMDGLIKGVLIAVGTSLKVIVGSLEMAFSTFVSGLIFLRDLVWGLITGDLELIKSAFTNLFSAFQEIGQKFIDVILGAFTGMINGIGELFGFKNLIDPLKAFFTETIPNVFNEAIENFKIEIKKDIDFIKGRFIGFVKNMFAPIIDFFAGIGDRIKTVVNGIIDSLPLPKFVKDKMKFETEATKAADESSPSSGPGPITSALGLRPGMSEASQYTEWDEKTQEYVKPKVIAEKPLMPVNTMATTQRSENPEALKRQEALSKFNAEDYIKASEKQYGSSIDPSELSDREKFKFMRTGKIGNPLDDQMKQDKFQIQAKIQASSIKPSDNKQTPIIINKGGDTNNASVQQKSETYTGPLDTGIDPYFDRASYNSF